MVRSTFPTAAAAAALMTAMAVVVWFAPTALARNDDLFHYGRDTFEDDQGRRNFGQPDWSDVTCDDLETCVRSYVRLLIRSFVR